MGTVNMQRFIFVGTVALAARVSQHKLRIKNGILSPSRSTTRPSIWPVRLPR